MPFIKSRIRRFLTDEEYEAEFEDEISQDNGRCSKLDESMR